MSEKGSPSPLSAPVILKDYASEVNGVDTYEEVSDVTENISESEPIEKDEFSFDFNDDLGDDFNDNGVSISDDDDDDDGNRMNVADDVKEMGSEWITEFACGIIETEGARFSHNYTKINESSVKIAEQNGKVKEGTLDSIKTINKNNKKAIEETFKAQMEMIQEPLEKVLAKRNVKVTPESALIGAIVFSTVIIFVQLKDIKKQNDELISTIINNNNK